MNTQTAPTGHHLKLERVDARVKANALAAAMGVSPSRINRIEGEQFPSPAIVGRYRSALDTCRNVSRGEAA